MKSDFSAHTNAVSKVFEQPPPNPYQPPPASPNRADQSHFEDGLIWRRGEFMVLRFGAAIPPRCFRTGEKTTVSIEVVQKVRPAWVYVSLVAGIAPYFVLAPWFTQTVRLRVPISRELYGRHLRCINLGFALILIGVLVSIAGAVGSPLFSVSSVLLPIGIGVCLVGLFLSSNPPITLHVAALESDMLILGNIHPKCLETLPEEPPSQLGGHAALK